MPNPVLVQQTYDAAIELIDESDLGDVEGEALAAAVDRKAGDADFYGACQELKRLGRLDFYFAGDMTVGMVRRT